MRAFFVLGLCWQQQFRGVACKAYEADRMAALPFEVPKLAVTAVVDAGADFASRLERAMRRSAKVIEARARAGASPA